jgi:hypothetical protein
VTRPIGFGFTAGGRKPKAPAHPPIPPPPSLLPERGPS